MTAASVPELDFTIVRNFEMMHPHLIDQSVDVYRNAFLHPPYNEYFSEETARNALGFIFEQKGHMVVGSLIDIGVVALAAGYYKDGGLYYIEELAVDPTLQGKGFGKLTLRHLMQAIDETGPSRYGIRTNAENTRAIALYQQLGFLLEPVQEVVVQQRTNGRIGIDNRVHLTKKTEARNEMQTELKRMVVVYPSGNTTAVVFDQLLDTDRESLNRRIMNAWERDNPDMPEIAIEQCCFVTKASDPDCIGKVEMFGGEFCGNATRSVIQLLTGGKDYVGKIESSGVDFPLNFEVKDRIISVEMPLPRNDEENVYLIDEGIFVRLDGIVHMVVNDTRIQASNTPRKMLIELREKYNLNSEPAVGVCFFNEVTEKADFAVWVRDVDTIFDETACGSGTSCIGVAMSFLRKDDVNINVIQPSGKGIITKAHFNPDIDKVSLSQISGTVDYLFDGSYKL
ncbi:MAG: GNAT family N-acetyltransferase [bacterium]